MTKAKGTSLIPPVNFPDHTVFVRSISEKERKIHMHGDTQKFYTVVDSAGGLLAIVCGPHTYAFDEARDKGAYPVWMQ
ncbi:MAG: hypothetical protein ACI92I_000324 [Acidimicrobiales bacterium]|jgi:hypothetical protein